MREQLEKKFDGKLPEYLKDYFDSKPEIDDNLINEEFWKENQTELKKVRRTTNHPVFKEAPRNQERVEEDRKLTREEINYLIKLCEDDMYLFAIRYFPHYLKKPSSELHRFVYNLLSEEINKTREKGFKWAIFAPRCHSKSSLVSAIFPLWCICYNKKRFIILISDTAGQAEDFLSDIKREIQHNEKLKKDFPHIVGEGPIWRSNEIITKNNIKMLALGSGNQIRGRRFGIYRPDLVLCHEQSTEMFHDNKWIRVEDYPSAKRIQADGYELKIHGLPYPEVITYYHKYFIKTLRRDINTKYEISNAYREVQSLENNWRYTHYIGYPINYKIGGFESIDIYSPEIIRNSETGKIVTTKSKFKKVIPEEFYDTEFWWFVGLWWGDGYSSGKHKLNITINNKDTSVFNRLERLLRKYNKSFFISKGDGCFQVIICWSKFARWLKSWRVGNSKKQPPIWVESIDLKYQKCLIEGYVDSDGFIDYENNQIRITSIYYPGLLSLKRILARFDIAASIRSGIDQTTAIINNRIIHCQKKYDLRFRNNAKNIGYLDIKDQTRYKYPKIFIKDGYLWSKIKSIKEVKDRTFIPIKTDTACYLTHFGLSHNCDDLENTDDLRSKSKRDFLRHEWFDKDVLFVGGESGSVTDIIVVGTILGSEALLNALANPEEYPDWNRKKFKSVIKFSSSPLWNQWAELYKNRFDENRIHTARKFFEDHKEEMLLGTEVLWPEGDPYYDNMIEKYFRPSSFAAEKQNDPVDPTKILVSLEQLHFSRFSDIEISDVLNNRRRVVRYGALDPSLGKRADFGDFSCIVTITRDIKTGYLFVEDIFLERVKVENLIPIILKAHKKKNYHLFGIETNAFQYVVAESLRKASKVEGSLIPIKELTNYLDKKLRIEGIIPFLVDGTVIFDQDKYEQNQQYRAAIESLCLFTGVGDSNDDAPDALEMAIRIARSKKFKRLTKQTSSTK